ncbi:glycosyltransferase family 2 protein [Allocoprobacillus halotolerans]|uniref:Glycosyltransferase family 2 protein n=1 Tax=Allocoprobacillus halotolerans TaxID=2944914 RepID=A0ABY5I3N4_9FIRM|nr:glycosyltransferase family 2 protein [Allocoprobacillus halotolerans]UTY39953.1 glycosyltransferase family 2 protein [Allocoprobacillus halotolerans]
MCTIKYYLGYILGYKNKKKELQKLKSFTSISSEFPELLHKAKLLIANSNNELIYETINSFFDSNIKILKNVSNIEEHQVIVVCALKNEITRIKWFLDHYRNLGIKLFLICDNNSTDGTLDFLMQQNDVVLYQTTDKYNSQKNVLGVIG